MATPANSQFSVGYYSHIGGRPLNEDAQFHLTFKVDKRTVLVAGVADGMGGYEGGEAASQSAIQACQSFLVTALTSRRGSLGKKLLAECVRRAAIVANKAVLKRNKGGRSGTTLTFGVFTRSFAAIAHIGDSRCYLLSEGKSTQLTTDHVDDAGALTNRLGRWEDIEPDVLVDSIAPNSVYLFCSDGLFRGIGESTMLATMAGSEDMTQGCVRLVETARNNAGPGSDNVTALGVEIGSFPRELIEPAHNMNRVKRVAKPISHTDETQQIEASARAARYAQKKQQRDRRFLMVSAVIILILLALIVTAFIVLNPLELDILSSNATDAMQEASKDSGPGLLDAALYALGAMAVACLIYLVVPSKK